MQTMKVFLSGEPHAVIDLGDGDFGLVNLNGTISDPDIVEIWYNHDGNGEGCNNLVFDCFGRELDLEFCRSRAATPDELFTLDALLMADGE